MAQFGERPVGNRLGRIQPKQIERSRSEDFSDSSSPRRDEFYLRGGVADILPVFITKTILHLPTYAVDALPLKLKYNESYSRHESSMCGVFYCGGKNSTIYNRVQVRKPRNVFRQHRRANNFGDNRSTNKFICMSDQNTDPTFG